MLILTADTLVCLRAILQNGLSLNLWLSCALLSSLAPSLRILLLDIIKQTHKKAGLISLLLSCHDQVYTIIILKTEVKKKVLPLSAPVAVPSTISIEGFWEELGQCWEEMVFSEGSEEEGFLREMLFLRRARLRASKHLHTGLRWS